MAIQFPKQQGDNASEMERVSQRATPVTLNTLKELDCKIEAVAKIILQTEVELKDLLYEQLLVEIGYPSNKSSSSEDLPQKIKIAEQLLQKALNVSKQLDQKKHEVMAGLNQKGAAEKRHRPFRDPQQELFHLESKMEKNQQELSANKGKVDTRVQEERQNLYISQRQKLLEEIEGSKDVKSTREERTDSSKSKGIRVRFQDDLEGDSKESQPIRQSKKPRLADPLTASFRIKRMMYGDESLINEHARLDRTIAENEEFLGRMQETGDRVRIAHAQKVLDESKAEKEKIPALSNSDKLLEPMLQQEPPRANQPPEPAAEISQASTAEIKTQESNTIVQSSRANKKESKYVKPQNLVQRFFSAIVNLFKNNKTTEEFREEITEKTEELRQLDTRFPRDEQAILVKLREIETLFEDARFTRAELENLNSLLLDVRVHSAEGEVKELSTTLSDRINEILA